MQGMALRSAERMVEAKSEDGGREQRQRMREAITKATLL